MEWNPTFLEVQPGDSREKKRKRKERYIRSMSKMSQPLSFLGAHGGILFVFVFVPQAEMGSHGYLLHGMPVKRKKIYISLHSKKDFYSDNILSYFGFKGICT